MKEEKAKWKEKIKNRKEKVKEILERGAGVKKSWIKENIGGGKLKSEIEGEVVELNKKEGKRLMKEEVVDFAKKKRREISLKKKVGGYWFKEGGGGRFEEEIREVG